MQERLNEGLLVGGPGDGKWHATPLVHDLVSLQDETGHYGCAGAYTFIEGSWVWEPAQMEVTGVCVGGPIAGEINTSRLRRSVFAKNGVVTGEYRFNGLYWVWRNGPVRHVDQAAGEVPK